MENQAAAWHSVRCWGGCQLAALCGRAACTQQLPASSSVRSAFLSKVLQLLGNITWKGLAQALVWTSARGRARTSARACARERWRARWRPRSRRAPHNRWAEADGRSTESMLLSA